MKNKGGRPKVEFNWDQLDSLCKLRLRLDDCAEVMQISSATIKRRIDSRFKTSFELYKEQKMAHTRQMVFQKGMDLVKSGNVAMTIFYLKNLCGMSDKIETVTDVKLTKDLVIEKINGDRELLKVE